MSGIAAIAEVRDSAAQSWMRALELTASIARNRDRTMPAIVDEMAKRQGDAPALLSDGQCLTYDGLASRKNQYARWALGQQIQKDEVVGLLMRNCPEYYAAWMGISAMGGVTALLNTNLSGTALLHCVQAANAKHIIVAEEFAEATAEVVSQMGNKPELWIHGAKDTRCRRIDRDVEQRSGSALRQDERRSVGIEDRALCVFTSGTSGLPKAANLSHARVLQWSYWFAGMLDIEKQDRMYNCLPMYHGIGGVLVPGAMIAGGGSVVVREKFSARQFWADVVGWKCTLFQYIGELCRYLLHGTSAREALGHQLRMICGNGMNADVWNEFQKKFNIPRVLEFYASTEGGVSLFNVEEERGSIGRVPPYLRHRFSPELVRCNEELCEPVRDNYGLCVRCGTNEVGEAIGKMSADPSAIGTRFEGYTDRKDSENKILRNVFKPGDAWVRTGDLMRRDERGYFYFVDRIGDTFRWKGENVASSEVSGVIRAYSGIQHAIAYGVRVPGTDGRAGMATVVTDDGVDVNVLRGHLAAHLPNYALPVFLRVCKSISVNGTFKYSKAELIQQGYDPAATADVIYFNHPEWKKFIRVDQNLFQQLQDGRIRV